MALKVITTVGISIFSNYWKKENIDELGDKYQSITDLYDRLDTNTKQANDYSDSRWKSTIRNIKERILLIWLPFAQEKACAEIQSLYKIAEEEKQDLEVYLIATDTVLSIVACELIKEWFDKYPSVKSTNTGIKCYFYKDIRAGDTTVVEGLQVKDADIFETQGFNNLLKIIEKYNEHNNTILNISGGYKALIPYLTLFGQLREIPLKYIYEDSETLITIGNLPFSLDWAVVEALKPFLNPYFLAKQDIQTLGKYWKGKKIKFENNRFIVLDNSIKNEFKELDIKTPFHQLFNSLVSYQLIIWNETEKQIQLSALGELISKFNFAIEMNKGYVIEHLLFKYFAVGEKKDITLGYKINLVIPNVPQRYVLNGKNVEIGDIDVWLNYQDEYNVWAEAKAISTAEGYMKAESADKYYAQLKSRILALNEPHLETLFIVFRFVFKEINDNTPFLNERLKVAVANLEKLNSDTDIRDKATFKCFGVSIPVNFKGDRVDLTESFYKGDFSQWTWEDITGK